MKRYSKDNGQKTGTWSSRVSSPAKRRCSVYYWKGFLQQPLFFLLAYTATRSPTSTLFQDFWVIQYRSLLTPVFLSPRSSLVVRCWTQRQDTDRLGRVRNNKNLLQGVKEKGGATRHKLKNDSYSCKPLEKKDQITTYIDSVLISTVFNPNTSI